jgi:plastocyanin
MDHGTATPFDLLLLAVFAAGCVLAGLAAWHSALYPAVIVCALLVAAAPQPGIAAGISSADLAKLPLLRGEHFEFTQKELHVKAGQTVTLRLENYDPEAHYLDIDELDVHTPIAPGKTSIAIFTPATPGTFLFYCHPHADKTTGEGMVGTLVVEP